MAWIPWLLASAPALHGMTATEFVPGVYREHLVTMTSGNAWRVTDPDVGREDARIFLPNPVFTFSGVNLDGALGAELAMHHWLGHAGTLGQQIVLNDRHRIDIPLNPNLNRGRSRRDALSSANYHNDSNPVFDVPLESLKNGENTLRGTIAREHRGDHWWGQWGWYWAGLRIHYPEESLDVPDGRIVVDTPGKVIRGDSVVLRFEPEDDAESRRIIDVTFYARYLGYDNNGNNLFYDWHGFHNHRDSALGAVGSTRSTPFEVEWDLSWIPDQQPGAISFVAVIRSSGRTYRVVEPLHGYSLERDHSVKVFRSWTFPKSLIRNNTTGIAEIRIPEVYPVDEVSQARLLVRTWNGHNNEQGYTPVAINDGPYMQGRITGANHRYGFDDPVIPTEHLVAGANQVRFRSTTVHHGAEILVPGPALLLRWDDPVPDYLMADLPPDVDGWYMSAVQRVHYARNSAPWLWSDRLGWIYAYSPYAESGWFHQRDLGYFWAHRESFPWVWIFAEEDWTRLD